MKITVIDGQGGRMGSNIIQGLKAKNVNAEIYAIGTNGIATSTMMKSGADFGATGENPIIVASRNSDIIVGPIGIVIADSFLGEITPKMSLAIAQSNAEKVLLPVNKCKIHIVCDMENTVSNIIDSAINTIINLCVKKIDTFI